ncbi:hypothetical protein [Streptomyces mirabilis]|uniref:hypothetical protein n=1 Tax=Streptomyces mirabilis TaxID=68239 RepID=UPI00324FE98F
MPITGWRVHATHRELARPRMATALMREFSALCADLDQRLDERGVPEGRPFPASPRASARVGLAVDTIDC